MILAACLVLFPVGGTGGAAVMVWLEEYFVVSFQRASLCNNVETFMVCKNDKCVWGIQTNGISAYPYWPDKNLPTSRATQLFLRNEALKSSPSAPVLVLLSQSESSGVVFSSCYFSTGKVLGSRKLQVAVNASLLFG